MTVMSRKIHELDNRIVLVECTSFQPEEVVPDVRGQNSFANLNTNNGKVCGIIFSVAMI